MASSLNQGEEMVPMRLSTQKSAEVDMKPVVAHLSNHKKSNGVIVIIVSIVFMSFFMLTVFSKNNPSSHAIQSNVNIRPPDIRYLVHSATIRGQRSERLVPIMKSQPQVITDRGMDFLMSYMMEPSLKSRASGDISYDPFDSGHLDPYLFVSVIPPLHSLVLNKFTSIPDHSTLLTYDDIETWFWCVQNMQAVGFYNSDPIAGSSQPHKHMQLVPLDQIYRMSPSDEPLRTLPVEKLIFPRIQIGEWSYYDPVGSKESIRTLSEFEFRHGILVLMDSSQWAAAEGSRFSYNEYLFAAYTRLLTAMDAALSPRRHLLGAERTSSLSYNFILAERWMMIVLRQEEDYKGLVSINGLGYIGLLMAKNLSAFERIREAGPLSVLSAVATPL